MAGSTTKNTAHTWQEEGLNALFAQLTTKAAVRHWQEKALAFFLEDGFPTRKLEDWRYTDLSGLLSTEYALSVPSNTHIDLSNFEIENCDRLVFVNGFMRHDLSEVSDDLLISPIQNLLQTADESLMREFRIELERPWFAGLNSALMNTGCYVKIKPNQRLRRPLHLLHVHAPSDQPTMQNLRYFIDVDRSSEASIIEEHVSLMDQPYFNNVVTQINLNFNAVLHYYKLQRDAMQSHHLATTIVSLGADSQFNSYVFSQGSDLSREDFYLRYYERGACAKLFGFTQAQKMQQVIQHVRIDHLKGQCTTQQQYRSIAKDKSKAVFDGKIVIHPGAGKSSAHQSSHNLLLSDTAEIDARPNLEIYMDDVVASHGATIGQLDEEALFYLQSRGIPREQAYAVLIASFSNEIFEHISNDSIRHYLKAAVQKELLHVD